MRHIVYSFFTSVLICAAALLSVALTAPPASAQVTAFKQAVAEAASSDEDMATFYRESGYAALWTGASDLHLDRRAHLMHALRSAGDHGLPPSRYDPNGLMQMLAQVRTPRDRGMAEVALSKAYLQYARDVQSGMLTPREIDRGMVREVSYRDREVYLTELAAARPAAYLRSLPPQSMEYNALVREKRALEARLAQGGWGPRVSAKSLKPGDAGPAVLTLRNRLIKMGFLARTNAHDYNDNMQAAVLAFQQAHGLNADGTAGATTLQQINVGVEERLQSVIVAMERERWVGSARGARHILVNIPDFSAKIIDDGKVTFRTRSVVGARQDERPTPEFSDTMTHMVINPSWYVPRSIATKEYLPALKRNPNALSHMVITDRRGRRVNRNAVDFNNYTVRSFPYAMRQPPSKSNALGLVKFMFPNKYNIYLHDTPAKNLFSRDVRAFSHGCVRLADPFDFAYELLSRQEADPQRYFQSVLRTGRELRVDLATPVPVHLIYRTAVTNAKGQMEYRADVYGRDAKIWRALSRAGVALTSLQG
ncbi:MAG: L,D-transpeptidase family protein [Pseudomonadota bacterium]